VETIEICSWQYDIWAATGVALALGGVFVGVVIWAIASLLRGEMLGAASRSEDRRW
jgi:hypothetical protein